MTELSALRRASWLRAKFWGSVFGIFSRGITSFQTTDAVAPAPVARDADAVHTEAGPSSGPGLPLSKKLKLPEGPLIVVANHSSHADSVALVAAIGRVRPLLVVAANDYWKQDATAEWLSRGLVGTLPVSRVGNGYQQLLEVAPLLASGVVVVIFAEGTRSRDGELQEFHSGAFQLAADTGARILPVAIVGTRDGLPRGATWPQRLPINLRFGSPIGVASDDKQAIDRAMIECRRSIGEGLQQPVVDAPQFGWSRVRRLAFGPVGLAVIFFWAFGEGMFWPLIAEMPLMLLVVTVGWRLRTWGRAAALIAASVLGSILGVTATWWLVDHGFSPPSPLTTARMFEQARAQLLADAPTAFWHQMLNGIPVKVYAHEAGALHLSFGQLLLALVPRVVRITAIGLGTWMLGSLLERWLKSCLGMVQGICLAAFPFGLWLTVGYWS